MQVNDNTTLGKSNFAAQNTPPLVEKVGNYLLLAGLAGAAIVALPVTMPTIVLPVIVLKAGAILSALGVIGKVFTKFFGTIPDSAPRD